MPSAVLLMQMAVDPIDGRALVVARIVVNDGHVPQPRGHLANFLGVVRGVGQVIEVDDAFGGHLREADKIGVGVGIGVEKEIGMAFGHEKLDSASEGMQFARNRANTERQRSTPIPTPTRKEEVIGNRQPSAGGDRIPRLRRHVRHATKRDCHTNQYDVKSYHEN
jgi:hypothetical protein